MFTVALSAIKNAPRFWCNIIKDIVKITKSKGWNQFNYWGLHLYLGMFGAGKTISAVRRVYNICCRHKGVTVLTNLNLFNFPKHTTIIKLVNSRQILDLPDKSIVLIDEIGSVFNSRDFSNGGNSNGKGKREVVPKPVYQLILQCRHRRIVLFGTVQKWNLLDKQLRDITDSVTVCRSYLSDPLCRYTTNSTYNAQEYDKWYTNPLLPLRRTSYDAFVQTDELRSKYDTLEMVEGMLNAEYIPDEQILQNREGIDFSPEDFGSDKKTKRKVKRFMRG